MQKIYKDDEQSKFEPIRLTNNNTINKITNTYKNNVQNSSEWKDYNIFRGLEYSDEYEVVVNKFINRYHNILNISYLPN